MRRPSSEVVRRRRGRRLPVILGEQPFGTSVLRIQCHAAMPTDETTEQLTTNAAAHRQTGGFCRSRCSRVIAGVRSVVARRSGCSAAVLEAAPFG